jgi:hypothetical protein
VETHPLLTLGTVPSHRLYGEEQGLKRLRTRRGFSTVLVLGMTVGALALQGAVSSAAPSVLQRITSGQLHAATLRVHGQTKTLPFLTHGTSTASELSGAARSMNTSAVNSRGISVGSLGCRERNLDRNVRVNQDCTYRRQAEEDIAYNPRDPSNLVAGMNDSIIGWNQTSLDFSIDSGRHWGAISTAPFRYRLNAPEDLLPTSEDSNQHTILGTPGNLHSYDACSDPYLAFDSEGRAFYTCVAFNIADNASLVFAVPSPVGAKGSYFDQVPAPFGLTAPQTGREHIIDEENSAGASSDGPKIAADAYKNSPNRDNVYETWTSFSFTCGDTHDQYCQSPIYGSMSTDHGFTWSTPEKISGTNSDLCVFGNAFDPSLDPGACNLNGHSDIAVRPNGDLTVTFQNGNTPDVNQQILSLKCSPSGSSPAGTAHLNCGGPSRVAHQIFENAPTCAGVGTCSPGAFIRTPEETSQRIAVNQRNGDLYDTWYDYRYGEFDIFLSRSTDGGSTWSAPRKVNPDHGTDHYFSAIDISERHDRARVGISYYRTGRVPNENNAPADGFNIGDPGVGQRMSDYVLSGGRKVSTPFAYQVLSPKFPAPDGIQAGFNGDYSGLVITPDGDAHPIWSDTRNAVPNPDFNFVTHDEDVFTASRDLPHHKRH